jgi:hypothetical protein
VLRYFKGSFLFTLACLAVAGWLGFAISGSAIGALGIMWIVLVLGVLETSLSFDNAVVNASVLGDMAPVWRKRFITWGILIAVVGMRIVFPLAIVAITAHLGPIDALKLAATDPVTYEHIIKSAHISISGFGGAFLGMVGLTFFLDEDKDLHWIRPIEGTLARLSGVSGMAMALVLLALFGVSRMLHVGEVPGFLMAGIFGLIAYIAVDGIGDLIGGGDSAVGTVVRSGLASFLYLEMLDASFSFDGVIGAFALSNNLFIIALGLGIGAMFVRSMTLMLVEKGTLTEYRFLEHGAFYAIVALSAIMLLSAHIEIPDSVTGLIGATFIGIAFLASVLHNRANPDGGEDLVAAAIMPSGERL